MIIEHRNSRSYD